MQEETQNPMPNDALKTKNTSWRLWTILIIVVILVGGFFIFQGNRGFDLGDGGVIVTRLQNNGDEFVLGEVTVPEGGGYIVIYERNADGTRTIYGQSDLLPAGTHTNVIVKRTTRRGGSGGGSGNFIAVAHRDDGDGEFNAETDEPFTDEDGEEISADITFEDEDMEADEVIEDDEPTMSDSSTDGVGGDDSGAAGSVPAGSITVSYTNDGFSPSPLTITQGQTVYFVNESNHGLWVASAVHPTHEEYPGSGIDNCGTATADTLFDACEALAVGEAWPFTFDEVGEWQYHNHVKSEETGTIVVEEAADDDGTEPSDDTATSTDEMEEEMVDDETATTTP